MGPPGIGRGQERRDSATSKEGTPLEVSSLEGGAWAAGAAAGPAVGECGTQGCGALPSLRDGAWRAAQRAQDGRALGAHYPFAFGCRLLAGKPLTGCLTRARTSVSVALVFSPLLASAISSRHGWQVRDLVVG